MELNIICESLLVRVMRGPLSAAQPGLIQMTSFLPGFAASLAASACSMAMRAAGGLQHRKLPSIS